MHSPSSFRPSTTNVVSFPPACHPVFRLRLSPVVSADYPHHCPCFVRCVHCCWPSAVVSRDSVTPCQYRGRVLRACVRACPRTSFRTSNPFTIPSPAESASPSRFACCATQTNTASNTTTTYLPLTAMHARASVRRSERARRTDDAQASPTRPIRSLHSSVQMDSGVIVVKHVHVYTCWYPCTHFFGVVVG